MFLLRTKLCRWTCSCWPCSSCIAWRSSSCSFKAWKNCWQPGTGDQICKTAPQQGKWCNLKCEKCQTFWATWIMGSPNLLNHCLCFASGSSRHDLCQTMPLRHLPLSPSYQNSPSTEAISASNLMAWRPCQVPEVRALQRQLVFCLHASKTMINGWLWHVLAQIVDERNASKCCASWYMDQPILYRVSFIQGRAGFRPSTVREYTVGRDCENVYKYN